MSALDELMGALRRSAAVSEWVAAARTRVVGAVRHGGGDARIDERRVDARDQLAATVHRDLPAGRGSARLVVAGGAYAAALDDAIERAGAAIGPAWAMAPPAAPAQVQLDDPDLRARRVDDAAEAIATLVFEAARAPAGDLARLAGAPIELVEVEVVVERETLEVASSQGLRVRWQATRAAVTALVAARGRTTIARTQARRAGGLELPATLAAAAERLGGLAAAASPPPGAYPIVLRLDALAPDDGGLGVWAAFAAQADAALARQGLSRYRPGHAIAPDAATDAEPLTVISDGALPFGLRSAPLGDDAEPVRRFALVERGVARELAFDQREAGLAGVAPNGGVRNLIVEPGATPVAAIAAGGPVLDVASLAWLQLDERTGELVAGVDLGYLRDGDAATPVTGAVIRGDIIAALARGRRSRETGARGAYQGPIAIRLPPLDVA